VTSLPELLAGIAGMWIAAGAIHQSPAATLVGVVLGLWSLVLIDEERGR